MAKSFNDVYCVARDAVSLYSTEIYSEKEADLVVEKAKKEGWENAEKITLMDAMVNEYLM